MKCIASQQVGTTACKQGHVNPVASFQDRQGSRHHRLSCLDLSGELSNVCRKIKSLREDILKLGNILQILWKQKRILERLS